MCSTSWISRSSTSMSHRGGQRLQPVRQVADVDRGAGRVGETGTQLEDGLDGGGQLGHRGGHRADQPTQVLDAGEPVLQCAQLGGPAQLVHRGVVGPPLDPFQPVGQAAQGAAGVGHPGGQVGERGPHRQRAAGLDQPGLQVRVQPAERHLTEVLVPGGGEGVSERLGHPDLLRPVNVQNAAQHCDQGVPLVGLDRHAALPVTQRGELVGQRPDRVEPPPAGHRLSPSAARRPARRCRT
jgi:hypothetical protein